jgi:hypothetical protein
MNFPLVVQIFRSYIKIFGIKFHTGLKIGIILYLLHLATNNICWRGWYFTSISLWCLRQNSYVGSCEGLFVNIPFHSKGLCVDFYCSTILLFITLVLLYNLKQGIVLPPALVFLLRIDLDICGFFCASMWISGYSFPFLWRMTLRLWWGLLWGCRLLLIV